MKMMGGIGLGVVILLGVSQPVTAATLSVVAAENFYGDVAEQVAGPDVHVASILSNPDDDPHMFEASSSVARALARANVVIANGADYDPWLAKLLRVSPDPARRVIVAADLVGQPAGGNPHLWYRPATFPAIAGAVATALASADPPHAADYARRAEEFVASLGPVREKIAALRARFAGTPVTATEPVFGEMAMALGLEMRNESFQRAVMNDTEPSASDVAAFEKDLSERRVKLMIYNSQASDVAAKRLMELARQAGIPVVGVTETEPAGVHVQTWLMRTLSDVERALSGTGS